MMGLDIGLLLSGSVTKHVKAMNAGAFAASLSLCLLTLLGSVASKVQCGMRHSCSQQVSATQLYLLFPSLPCTPLLFPPLSHLAGVWLLQAQPMTND